MNKMNRFFLLMVSFLLGVACNTSELIRSEEKTGLDSNINISNATPGSPVILTTSVQSTLVPPRVIPYGAKPAIHFSNLNIQRDGDFFSGKVDFTRINEDDFVLVTVISLDREVLFGYLDPESDFGIHIPSGMVLFGTDGYKISGGDSGSIQFSIIGNEYNGYNVFGKLGSVFVFSVPGKINPHNTLPGDQTSYENFQANSNVVKIALNPEDKGSSVGIKPDETDLPASDVSMGSDPTWGPADASVKVVAFLDFQDSFSEAWFQRSYTALKAQYETQVQFAIRNFPISFHQDAESAAESSLCAGNQGLYWSYVEALLAQTDPSSNVSSVTRDRQDTTAVKIGLDVSLFRSCRDGGKHKDDVQKDIADGMSYGVGGVPTFFVNGHRLIGSLTENDLQAALDSASK